MAAPRCARSIWGPAKRVKIATPRSNPQVIQRWQSSSAGEDDAAKVTQNKPSPFKEGMELDERLKDLGIDPKEYQALYRSQQKVDAEWERNEPKTAKEAAKKWKEAQDTPDHYSLLHMYKQAGVEPLKLAKERGLSLPHLEKPPLPPNTQKDLDALRSPINVRAMHLRPLRRTPEHGVPVCDLQLRTYSVRNIEFFADFAMRVAYYMGLCARGPIPLPRITERWTVPRSNFIFKKSQENFERITLRRLIQIQDGHPDVVKAWLAFLLEHQFHGVGMKANIFTYESLDDALNVGAEVKEGEYEGRREKPMLDMVDEILQRPGYKEAMKGFKAKAELRP